MFSDTTITITITIIDIIMAEQPCFTVYGDSQRYLGEALPASVIFREDMSSAFGLGDVGAAIELPQPSNINLNLNRQLRVFRTFESIESRWSISGMTAGLCR